MNAQMVQMLESSMPGMLSDDEGLASVIDLNAPVDVSVYKPPQGELRLALAMGAGDLDHAASVLADGHRLDPLDNGVRRVLRSGDNVPPPDPACVLAPSFGTVGARVVCAERDQDITALIPYITRTLPRRPIEPPPADLLATVAMPQVRVSLADDARSLARDIIHQFGLDATSQDPQLEAARAWAREMWQSIPRSLDDVSQAELRVTLPDSGLDAALDLRVDRTTAPALQHLLSLSRDPHPPFAELERLPSGGWMYAAASVALQQIRPSLNVLPTLLTHRLLQGTATPGGEGAALNTAIASLLAQDTIAYAASVGVDDAGHYWNVSRFQATTPPAQLVSNLRAFFTALTRPAITRAVQAHHHVQLAQWRVAPPVGLPPGALLVRVPQDSLIAPPPVAPALAGRPRPPSPTYEFLFVPDGAQVWFVAATNARERLRGAQAQHPAPIDTHILQGDGVTAAAALIPAAAVGFFHDDPSFQRQLSRLVQGASDHGTTPATVRLSTTANTTSDVHLRVTLPRQTLEMVGQALRGVGGAAPAHP